MRVTQYRVTRLFALLLVSLSLLAGCDEGPAENAGEEVDEAIENTQDSLDEAQEETEDALDQ